MEPRRNQPIPAESWLDRFFAAYYRHRPVNATFIGVHQHDTRLPDLSESGLGDLGSGMSSLLAEGAALPDGDPPLDDEDGQPEPTSQREHLALDVKLARGFLRIQSWEIQSSHGPRGNPSLHTGEAVFGLLSLFLSDFAPLEERVESASARLAGIPVFLEQARNLVREAPPEWTARALRECDGALAFLTEGISQLSGFSGSAAANLEAAAAAAARAFSDHRAHLAAILGAVRRHDSAHAYGCGEEALALHLSEGHFLTRSADELSEWARAELAEAAQALQVGAAGLGSANPQHALEGLRRIHPSVPGYYSRYEELWTESRDRVLAHDLVTWPEFPIRYVPRPMWARAAAPSLYFLFYRSPSAFNRPAVHDYLVTPIDGDMDPAEQERLLQANNDSVIKLNHVVHHGGIGHHIQNWHAFRSSSRVGQVAAVDCSGRIAMFCGGTMAEGWACYATDLMREHGFLTPLEELAELRSRTRMCARAVVDVELHSGRFSMEQAADFYVHEAGMSREGAQSEAVKNSMFPGGAVMYLAGTDAIHELREQQRLVSGNAFTLREFHDKFLSYGSVPVALIADDMRGRPLTGVKTVDRSC